MNALNARLARVWGRVGTRFLPIAEALSEELPLSRLLRLSLFQVTVGMAVVLMIGTLNRVMIVELGVPARLVAFMVALPLVFAPLRAVIGYRSDAHRSVLGWKRVPYLWMGTLIQFGGLAIMPFALILLSGDSHAPPIVGECAAALAFLLTGIGMHTVQTVGLALATDVAPAHTHHRVVTLLCGMLLVGMMISAVLFGILLANFSEFRLIQVIQGSAVVTLLLNVAALWKQEARRPWLTSGARPRQSLRDAWNSLGEEKSPRRLIAVALGTIAFSMQDILLEPYGGQILHLSVGTTTTLTALLAVGGIAGFLLAARGLGRGMNPYRLAGGGVVIGLSAFSCVIFAAPLQSAVLFGAGTLQIGLGAAWFAVGTLTAAMRGARANAGLSGNGLALGTWGAVQAAAAGFAIAAGGLLRDTISALAISGRLGPALADPQVGYSAVYHLEIYLLLATLIALGPLVRRRARTYPWQPLISHPAE